MWYSFDIFSLGKTQENRDVWMLDVGDQKSKDNTKSHVLMLGGLHGNEAVGPELLLQIAVDICENNGKDFIISKVMSEYIDIQLLHRDCEVLT